MTEILGTSTDDLKVEKLSNLTNVFVCAAFYLLSNRMRQASF